MWSKCVQGCRAAVRFALVSAFAETRQCVVLLAVSCGCSGSPLTNLPAGAGSGSGSGAASGGSSGSGGGSDGRATDGGGGGSDATTASDGAAAGDSGLPREPGVDASSADADSGSARGKDAGGGPVAYPPLKFSDIGTAVQVSGSFLFTEGPVWDPAKNVLYFTDINADTVYRLTLPNTFDTVVKPAGNADGLGLDPQGNLIAAGFVARNVWRFAGSAMQTIASSYQGKKLNSPDDITARSDGVIYFTDPVFGINGSQGFTSQTQEQGTQGVYRVTTDGTVHLEDSSTSGPNGIDLSPDEHTLYVAYTSSGEVAKFVVGTDGALSGRSTFASGVTIADSMSVDAGGNVYVASFSGIAVFSPAGTRLGTIATGSQIPTNCAFGGADQKTFFITARTGLTGTPTAGNSSIYRIDNMPIPGIPGRN
jgi:gluconolactonase